MVRAVVFDMDGLMVDTEPLYIEAALEAAADLGYEIDEGFFHGLIGSSNADSERMLLDRLGPDFPVGRFKAGWVPRWQAIPIPKPKDRLPVRLSPADG